MLGVGDTMNEKSKKIAEIIAKKLKDNTSK
jgi:hypothetical protein